jgi:predicted MFS family arabinose efflux permease
MAALGTNTWKIKFSGFASLFDQTIMAPMLLAIAKGLHTNLALVVTAASFYFLGYGIMQPFWGIVGNRFSPKRAMEISLALASIFTLATVLSSNIQMLLLFRGISGCFMSASIPAALALLGSTPDPSQRQREISGLMVATASATASATILSGVISHFFGWRWVFALSSAIGLMAFFAILRSPNLMKSHTHQTWHVAFNHLLKNRTFVQLMVITFMDGIALLSTMAFVPTAVESSGASSVSAAVITAGYGVSVLGFSIRLSRSPRQRSLPKYILIGSGLGAIACFVLYTSHGLITALIACLLMGICSAMMHSSLQTWATEVAPREKFLATSLFALFLFIGSAVGTSFAGQEASRSNFSPIFLRASLLFIIIGFLGSHSRKTWEKRSTISQEN